MERIRDAIQKARIARSEFDDELGPEQNERLRSVRGDKSQSSAAAWAQLPEFTPNPRHLARNRIVTMECEDPSYVHFDIMRTRVLSSLKQNGWKSVALTSPTPSAGKTMVAVNLAFSFARQKELRTLLIDVDLRRPSLASVIGLKSSASTASFLTGESDGAADFVRVGNNLAILAASAPHPNSSEILSSSQARRSLDALFEMLRPDVVIFDLPPLKVSDDTLAFLPNADSTLLIVEAEKSSFQDVDETEQELAEKSNLLGVVLNKCRFVEDTAGYYKS
jgi:protein-tyrosine kinase